jgi:hypothetical protein
VKEAVHVPGAGDGVQPIQEGVARKARLAASDLHCAEITAAFRDDLKVVGDCRRHG